MKQTARDVARATLAAFRRDGAWSDGYLKHALQAAELDPRDAALATQLVYGVLQNRMLCDFYIASCSNLKFNKIAPGILDVLRIGVYQLLFLERIPAHAAVNDAVKAARRNNPRAAGFVNAVLRKIDSGKDTLPKPEDDAVLYSHPEWIVDLLFSQYGKEVGREILKANNRIPPITARVNTLRIHTEELLKLLPQSEKHPWLSDCIILRSQGSIEQLPGFSEGYFQIQDVASQLAALAGECQPGHSVLDTCAAPGGKTCLMAQQMQNRGELISCDVHPHKIKLIEANARRLGIENCTARVQDATQFCAEFESRFDVVLSDVPCSGLGVIRKKADIRYKEKTDIFNLPTLQLEILQNSARYVKAGGKLVYSTCTIRREENQEVVQAFLKENSSFEIDEYRFPGGIESTDGMLTLLPHQYDTDGFFICRMRRKV